MRKYQNEQETLKLTLNGAAGKTKEKSSWMYCEFTNTRIALTGQIDILKLVEMLELNNIGVISTNTDGLVVLMDKSQEELYYQICKEWEKIVGNDVLGNLEYQDYTKLVQTSVNDYIAFTPEGKIKKKGDFATDFELHKNKSFRVIPLAIEQYFLNGIPVEKTIREHKNIFDFCGVVKGNRDWKFLLKYIENGLLKEKELQRINRYYISRDGAVFKKQSRGVDNKESFVHVHPMTGNAWKVKIANTILPMEQNADLYNIDYSFYITEANKILNNFNKNTLF